MIMQGLTAGGVGFAWGYMVPPDAELYGIDSELLGVGVSLGLAMWGPQNTRGTAMASASTLAAIWSHQKGRTLGAAE